MAIEPGRGITPAFQPPLVARVPERCFKRQRRQARSYYVVGGVNASTREGALKEFRHQGLDSHPNIRPSTDDREHIGARNMKTRLCLLNYRQKSLRFTQAVRLLRW
jgi:hypothetical protein